MISVHKYTARPDNVFKASVYQWGVGGDCFLLRNQVAVKVAVAQGAIPLPDAPALSVDDLGVGRSRRVAPT